MIVLVWRMKNLTPVSLRAARAILKWTLQDLERASGVAFSTIHKIEQGERKPQDTTATKLIAAFTANGVDLFAPPADGARRTPPKE